MIMTHFVASRVELIFAFLCEVGMHHKECSHKALNFVDILRIGVGIAGYIRRLRCVATKGEFESTYFALCFLARAIRP